MTKDLAPHSTDAEEAVLGSVIVSPDVLTELDCLEPNHFFLLRNQFIWEAIQRLRNRDEAIDNLTVIEELRQADLLEQIGGGAYITYLINNTPTARHAASYAQVVYQAAIRRKLLGIAQDIARLAVSEKYDVETVLNHAQDALSRVVDQHHQTLPAATVDAADFAGVMLKRFLSEDQPRAIQTGIPGWDRALGGGFFPQSLHALVAVSGSGKSILLKQFALHAAKRGKRVLICQLEDGPEIVDARLLGELAKVNPRPFQTDQPPPNPACNRCRGKDWSCSCCKAYKATFTREVYEPAKAALEALPGAIQIDCTPMHVDQWEAHLKRLDRQQPFDVVMVDYGQKVQFRGDDENRAHAKFANDLATFAVAEHKAVIVALQLHKQGNAGFNKPPTPNNIRGTTAWFNAITTMTGLYRPLEDEENMIFGEHGVLTFPKLRNMPPQKPVRVQLFEDGLFFGEVTRQEAAA